MSSRDFLSKARAGVVLGLVLLTGIWSGCGQDGVLSAPDATEPDFTPLVRDGTPLGTRGSAGVSSLSTGEQNWFVVGEGLATKNQTRTITSEHCNLTFFEGAVDKTSQVKIYMYDLNILEFEFTPDGVPFDVPVRVDVDYSGTNADPDSPNYDGSVPAFFWFNPNTDLWEEVAGSTDSSQKTYTAYVEHFSRYTLGSKPGDGTADW